MTNSRPKPIRIPWSRRWQDARMRLVPLVIFGAALCSVVALWRERVAAPTMIGQAEPVLSNVSSHKAGVLTELRVNRFQRVKAGDPIGEVWVANPAVLTASIAVIQADIEMLRTSLTPILRQQHNALSYNNLRLNYMRQRTELAMAKASLQEARTQYERMEQLYKDGIIAQRRFEDAQTDKQRLEQQVLELTQLVEEQAKAFPQLQLTNSTELSVVTEDPIRKAIEAQEAKLQLTEAELAPVPLKASMDGIVTTIYHRSGESVTAGQPIVSIATLYPTRIVGYLRPPIVDEPAVDMRVEVRTRGLQRATGQAKILEVGTQLEPIPATLLGAMKLAGVETGLPIEISVPPHLKIRAGEQVDLVLIR